jgi:formylmethanofuran dehydrogenase subunit B
VSATAITCPFCGLACDDLALSETQIDTRGCAKAATGFARSDAPEQPHRVAGRPVDLAAAAAAAAALLKTAIAPLFHGLAADLHGIRALLELVDRSGGVVDHLGSGALFANITVARASGWVTATFGEIANRADFVLVIGADPARNFPRLHERLIANRTPLYRQAPPVVAYLGPAGEAPASAAPTLTADLVTGGDLLDALGVLAASLRGRAPRKLSPSLPLATLAAIGERLAAARYGGILWDATQFAADEAELAVELIASMLRRLNEKTRCVGLPLGGSANGLGAMQATLWQTGWPLRVGFGGGAPLHDPWRFDGNRLLAAGEADLLVWAATLTAEPPPTTDAPVIAIVAHDVALPSPAAVEIRVGIPAIDHAGEIVRSDTVVALPLQAALPSARLSVADAARAVLAAWDAMP